VKQFGGRVVDLALSLLLGAVLLNFAWSIIRPFAPVLVVVAIGFVVWRYLIRRRRSL